MIRAFIIDDEKPARDKLLMLVQQHFTGRILIVAQCEDGEEALKAIVEHKPDLLFLDVEMPRLSGFDVLRGISQMKPSPLSVDGGGLDVIFTTAYDHYAIKAIKFAAIDYLLKPIDIDQLKEAITRVEARKGMAGNAERVERLVEDAKQGHDPTRLSIPSQQGYVMVKTAEIVWCEAVNYYSVIHLVGGKQIVSTRSLKEVEDTLEGGTFLRIHRGHLINLDHLTRYIRGNGGQVVMSSGKELEVARLRKDELLARIGG